MGLHTRKGYDRELKERNEALCIPVLTSLLASINRIVLPNDDSRVIEAIGKRMASCGEKWCPTDLDDLYVTDIAAIKLETDEIRLFEMEVRGPGHFRRLLCYFRGDPDGFSKVNVPYRKFSNISDRYVGFSPTYEMCYVMDMQDIRDLSRDERNIIFQDTVDHRGRITKGEPFIQVPNTPEFVSFMEILERHRPRSLGLHVRV